MATISLLIDSAAVLCGLVMVARMKHVVTARARRFGVIAVALHTAGQLAVYFSPLRIPGAIFPDLALAAVVFGFTALTVGRWERLVADGCLDDPKSDRNDLQGKIGWVMLPVLIFALLFEWATA